MKMILTAVATTLSVAGTLPAFAGGPVEPIPEPAPVVAPVVYAGSDWTGFSVGVTLGYGTNNFSEGVSTNGSSSGGLAGLRVAYDYDFGLWTLGLEGTLDNANIGGNGNGLHELGRLGVRLGYDIGTSLTYLVAGDAMMWATIPQVGNRTENGFFFGIGAEHMVADHWTVGGEILSNKFGGANAAGGSLTATTISLLANYRF